MLSAKAQIIKIALEQRLREGNFTLEDLEVGLKKQAAGVLIDLESLLKVAPGVASALVKYPAYAALLGSAGLAGTAYLANKRMTDEEKTVSQVKNRQKALQRAIKSIQDESAIPQAS